MLELPDLISRRKCYFQMEQKNVTIVLHKGGKLLNTGREFRFNFEKSSRESVSSNEWSEHSKRRKRGEETIQKRKALTDNNSTLYFGKLISQS